MSQQGIPVVDLSSFTSSTDTASQQRTAQQLREILPLNGSVGISGHGVSPDLLAKAFATSKELFDLPYEDKMKAPHPDGPTPHRGYSGTGRERAAAKIEAETEDETKKEEYAKTTDIKVFIIAIRSCTYAWKLTKCTRRATRLEVTRTNFSTTSGCLKTFFPGSVALRPASTGS